MSQAPEVTVMQDPNVVGRITLYGVRIAFAELNEPKSGKADKQTGKVPDPKFSSVFLIPYSAQAAIQEVQAALWKVAQAKWGERASVEWQMLTAKGNLALKDGATKADNDGFLNHVYINASNTAGKVPTLLSNQAGPDGGPATLPRPQSMIYSGCYVNVQLDLWAQDNDYGKRINCEMKVVQFNQNGDAFGGGAAADMSAFKATAPAAPGGFATGGQAPAMSGFGGQPQQPAMGGFPQQPPAQGGFGGAPAQGGFGGAPAQGGFPQQPPAQGGFPQQPPAQGGAGFGGQPQQAPAQFGAAPQPGFGGQPQFGGAPQFGAAPQAGFGGQPPFAQ